MNRLDISLNGWTPRSTGRPAIGFKGLVSLFALLSVALFPDTAFAAATLGDVICNIQKQLTPYGDFVSAVSYVVGAFFVGSGISSLKTHSDNPNQAPMSRSIMQLVGGAGALSLPEVAHIVQLSMSFSAGNANGLSTCSPGTVATVATGSLDVIFSNLFKNIGQPMQTALSALCLVMGAFFVAKGLMRAAKYGTDARASSVQAIMANLVVGAILLSVGQMTDIVMQSMFGVSVSTITTFPTINWGAISSTASSGTAKATLAVNAVLIFVQVIGMIAFLRGWLIVKAAVEGSGQATLAQGITHILGGVMAINIGGMAVIFNNTFGLNIVS